MGNPVTQKIPSYRKTVISRLHALTFLDDRPVSDEERLQIEAWAKGGLDAEREERRRQSEFKHSEHLRNHECISKLNFILILRHEKDRRGSQGEATSELPR